LGPADGRAVGVAPGFFACRKECADWGRRVDFALDGAWSRIGGGDCTFSSDTIEAKVRAMGHQATADGRARIGVRKITVTGTEK